MKTVLLLVEDKKFIPAIANYFRYLKHSVRVVSANKRFRIGNSSPDLMIVQVDSMRNEKKSFVLRILEKLPHAKALYLSVSRNSEVQRALTKIAIPMMTETKDLQKIYKRINRLRSR